MLWSDPKSSSPVEFRGVRMILLGGSNMSRYAIKLLFIQSNQVYRIGKPEFSSHIWFSFRLSWLNCDLLSHSETIVNIGLFSEGYESGKTMSTWIGINRSQSIFVWARFPDIDLSRTGMFASFSIDLWFDSKSACSIGSQTSTFIGLLLVSIGILSFKK